MSYLEIADLTGIEYFKELKGLNCAGNNLKKLDISVIQRLEVLTCSGNPLKDLRISGNAYLRVLHTEDTLIKSLDVSEQQGLTDLIIDKDVEVTGAEREGLKVVLMTRNPHPEWETDSR